MDNRETGLVEIFNRIAAKRTALGLVSFKRNPTIPSEDVDLPCVFMLEGVDRITKHATRNPLGYPAQRVLDVMLEVLINKRSSFDIKSLSFAVKKAAFTVVDSDPEEYSVLLAENTFIQENRMEGPLSYGLPDIEAMRVILDLTYIDGGF